ncbi:6-phosphogluconolactonase [candidate division KSB1 bacterium]|nr:6-phosphogluconolactonase [candidate division KSB1 bacterium]
MKEPTKPDIRIFPNQASLNRAAAEAFAQLANKAVAEKGRFTVALAGGNTPRTIYQLLATEYREQIDWSRAHFFWGDERYVPSNDPDSNYRMARESLFDHVPILAENVHRMTTEFIQPKTAAQNYEKTLRDFWPVSLPRFDLIQLGLGLDGHIASLFPNSPLLQEKQRLVTVVTDSPKPPPTRITLTLPAINNAAQIHFFVAGAEKAEALRSTLQGPRDWQKFPAQAVQPANGQVIWWVDDKAASLLK